MAILEAQILRIYVGENDLYSSSALEMYQGRPLYEVIVKEARRHGLAGASVMKGVLGYGAGSRIHQQDIWRSDRDLPMIVEIVDRPTAIGAFLPEVQVLAGKSLVTLETIQIVAPGP